MESVNSVENITAVLDEIAERLWSGHASVMIGAGFSKNAIQNGPNCKPFLSWAELANIFYHKLHGKMPSEKEHYLNPLKLADELQAAFGRPTLEKIIQTELPDLDYSPSDLHRNLLELPWNDVFTTNYDTLLERAKVTQRYDIVVNKNELVYSQRPRIVKLHGSFPSERPFIITEEDFRKYPRDYAAFVNTVQQSLIENTLCLIGFSGDDPNFLSWIGWIRDNLGSSNSPKMYLVGNLDLSNSQIRLLEQRNISVVNLSTLVSEKKEKHKEAIKTFLTHLKNKKKEENRLDWPYSKSFRAPPSDSFDGDVTQSIQALLQSWQADRISYPGWIVCPEENRRVLWSYTSGWIHGKHLGIQLLFGDDINFWFELSWRLKKCLSPLFDQLVPKIEETIARYNPFPEAINQKSEFHRGAISDRAWDEIGKKWLELQMALLRFYREEGLVEKWNLCYQILQSCKSEMSAVLFEELQYEKCLYFLYQQDIVGYRKQLETWAPDNSTPFYQAKKAGLLAELGNVSDAVEILESALKQIRTQLNLVPITTDYSHLSEEAHVLQLLKFVKDSSFDRSSKDRAYIEEYNQRWDKLKQYKCDPWGELKVFDAKLDRPLKEMKDVEKIPKFDIGESSTTRHFGRTDVDAIEGFAFLRYIEDIGVPFHVPGMSFGTSAGTGAISRISHYSPSWAMAVLFRIGDEKSVDVLFSRKSLQLMTLDRVENLTNISLALINNVKGDIEKADGWKNQNIGTHFAKIIPEILSRLCTRNSLASKYKTLDFLLGVYRSEHRAKYSNIQNLTKRLIIAWPNSELNQLVTVIISDFPIVESEHPTSQREFQDPLLLLDREEVLAASTKISIKEKVVEAIIAAFDRAPIDRRREIFERLAKIFDFGLMPKQQLDNFAQSLWREVDDQGFPKGFSDIYRWCFLDFPQPSTVKVEQIYYDYLTKLKFPIVGKSKSFPFNGGMCLSCSELIGGSRHLKRIGWISSDAQELFEKIHSWWVADKQFLENGKDHQSFMSRHDEMKSKFYKGIRVLCEAVFPHVSEEFLITHEKKIESLIQEMRSLNLPVSELESAYILRIQNKKEQYLSTILDDVSSSDDLIASRGVIALTKLSNPKSNEQAVFDYSQVLFPIIEVIKWRKVPALAAALANFKIICQYQFDEWKTRLDDVLFGLKFLISESSLLNDKSQIHELDRLYIREYAASLASELHKYFKSEAKPIPVELQMWESVCRSDDEFAEIKNQWADA